MKNIEPETDQDFDFMCKNYFGYSAKVIAELLKQIGEQEEE